MAQTSPSSIKCVVDENIPIPSCVDPELQPELYNLLARSPDHRWWMSDIDLDICNSDQLPDKKNYSGFANLDKIAYWGCINLQLSLYTSQNNCSGNGRIKTNMMVRAEVLPRGYEAYQLCAGVDVYQCYRIDTHDWTFHPTSQQEQEEHPDELYVELTFHSRDMIEAFYLMYIMHIYTWSEPCTLQRGALFQNVYMRLVRRTTCPISSSIRDAWQHYPGGPLPTEIESWLRDVCINNRSWKMYGVFLGEHTTPIVERIDSFCRAGMTVRFADFIDHE